MTQFTDQAMELARDFAVTARCPGHTGVETLQAREALRQHLERGEPDCRTCDRINDDGDGIPSCYEINCTNGSEYKRAEFKMLWK